MEYNRLKVTKMNDEKSLLDFGESFYEFLVESGVKNYSINGVPVAFDKTDAVKKLIELCDSSLTDGNICNAKVNNENLAKYKKANELGLQFFCNKRSVDVEMLSNLSFASTTIECEYFNFEVEKQNQKELFLDFVKTIDSLDITTGTNNMIRCNFTVNNVWEGEPIKNG